MLKGKDYRNLGIPEGPVRKAARIMVGKAGRAGMDRNEIRAVLRSLTQSPDDYLDDPLFGGLAEKLTSLHQAASSYEERVAPAPYHQWGANPDPSAVRQMENACQLPISQAGALMPDAHTGYGLPIGGVLAVRDAVIPYAVGMDIACRMKMTVLDWPVSDLTNREDRLVAALNTETSFGVGATHKPRRQHRVMDEDWSFSRFVAGLKDKARNQLGTSGSGNHFVEFGVLEMFRQDLGLEPGNYPALLSHSGSRGTGGEIATHFSRLAMKLHPELPRGLNHLAWLDINSEAGREYWLAMELMGRYAAANHELIHRSIADRLGFEVLADVENHHNFAWKEVHDGREVIVHRKGATPAHEGALGIIPGSMATPGYVVRGRGNPLSLNSAAHGAGRRMSRKEALKRFNWKDLKSHLEHKGVVLLSAGLDEAPMAYKDIETVMDEQRDLVEKVARFHPRLVKMAPGGK